MRQCTVGKFQWKYWKRNFVISKFFRPFFLERYYWQMRYRRALAALSSKRSSNKYLNIHISPPRIGVGHFKFDARVEVLLANMMAGGWKASESRGHQRLAKIRIFPTEVKFVNAVTAAGSDGNDKIYLCGTDPNF